MKWGKLAGFLIILVIFFSLVTKVSWARSNWCNNEIPPQRAADGEGPDLANPKIYTALGCIPVVMGGPDGFVVWLIRYVMGIAGGIAFLLMIYGFIQMSTSKGDPKVVQGAKETITSAITGLVVCILFLFLLRLIGRDILKIPGF